MTEYKLRLELSRKDAGHSATVIEETAQSEHDATAEGEENLGIELAAEFRKAIRYFEYFREIPDLPCNLTDSVNRTIDLSKWWDVRNTENLWLEISNTIADIRFLLAQARAYKALEPSSDKQDRRSEQLRYDAHFAKMYHLNLSIF